MPRRRSSEPELPEVEQLEVGTPAGPARAYVSAAAAPRATLVLGHGAGRGSDTADLLALAAGLPAAGISVVRLDQPWVVAGRKVAPTPAALDQAWLAAVPQLPTAGRLVLGGRSAGARVACRTARALGASAVACLAFPLHPPGRPERSRAEELRGVDVPLLVVQGERDAFGRPEELLDHVERVVPVPGADHSLAVPRSAGPGGPQAALDLVVAAIRDWLTGPSALPGPSCPPPTAGRR
ncbi:alpha/beta hydrolase family protein [Motilibacter deserti]|uniref:Hydrolase n=1 Tax=Motilibacter deserti TaxID=2714956 RepID=A0ABX0GR64_9ACTN|nr:alpha/beta family hydrolase [Motilibacter deserti]NHC13347.1 hydrolase [Motilibacter deserti]